MITMEIGSPQEDSVSPILIITYPEAALKDVRSEHPKRKQTYF